MAVNPERRLGAERGIALTEVALVLPLFLILFIGTIDFCRIFYAANAMTHAARAGVQYGAQDNATAVDTAGMKKAALDAATDLGDPSLFTVTPTFFCKCSNGSSVSCVTGTCAEGLPRIYVQVMVQKTFHTLVSYPGIPSTTDLTRTAVMRAQ